MMKIEIQDLKTLKNIPGSPECRIGLDSCYESKCVCRSELKKELGFKRILFLQQNIETIRQKKIQLDYYLDIINMKKSRINEIQQIFDITDEEIILSKQDFTKSGKEI